MLIGLLVWVWWLNMYYVYWLVVYKFWWLKDDVLLLLFVVVVGVVLFDLLLGICNVWLGIIK